MASLNFLAGIAIFAVGALAVPAPTPAPTPAPVVSLGPFTLGGGYSFTHTVINSQTYPIIGINGQGGYEFTQTSVSATGLLGLGLSNRYTTVGSEVFPILDFTLAEADSELLTIPGFLTFRDGGLSTGTAAAAQHTDVLCTVELPLNAACEGLAGLVTGNLLGQPFTLEGGNAPTLTVPVFPGQTFAATNDVQGTAGIGAIGGGGDTGPLTIGGNIGPFSANAGFGPPISVNIGGLGMSVGLVL